MQPHGRNVAASRKPAALRRHQFTHRTPNRPLRARHLDDHLFRPPDERSFHATPHPLGARRRAGLRGTGAHGDGRLRLLGGIGMELNQKLRQFDYGSVLTIVLVVLAVVIVLDRASALLRKRLA